MFIFTVGMHVLLGHVVYVTVVDTGYAGRCCCWRGEHPNSWGCRTGTRVPHLTCNTSVADIVNVIGCCVRWLFIKVLRDWLVCIYFRIAPLLHVICQTTCLLCPSSSASSSVSRLVASFLLPYVPHHYVSSCTRILYIVTFQGYVNISTTMLDVYLPRWLS